jgi:hypothetical protein
MYASLESPLFFTRLESDSISFLFSLTLISMLLLLIFISFVDLKQAHDKDTKGASCHHADYEYYCSHFNYPFCLILISVWGFRGMHLTSLSFVPKRRCLRIDDIPTFSPTGDFALPAEKEKQPVVQAVKKVC